MATDEKQDGAATLPEGWPVSFVAVKKATSENKANDNAEGDEENAQEEVKDDLPTLKPGSCLQACNGSDIQLARGACARPNLAKGKGRYLILLPGMMSLKTQAKVGRTSAAPKKVTPDAAAADDQEAAQATPNDAALEQESETATEENDAQASLNEAASDKASEPATEEKDSAQAKSEDAESEQATSSAADEKESEQAQPDDAATSQPSKAAPKRFAPSGVALGKIEKIATDNPLLKIPFGDGRTMVFQGKKIDSSSKFMMLNCKSSKSSVVCKSIFSSVIIFGESSWENSIAKDGDHAKKSDTGYDAEKEGEAKNEEEADVAPFRHYGGSDRTVDGDTMGATKKQAKRRSIAAGDKTSTKAADVLAAQKLKQGTDSSAEVEAASVAPTKDAELAKNENENDDDSDIVLDDDGGTVDKSSSRPRRAAASRKRKQATDDSDSDYIVVLDDEVEDSGAQTDEPKETARRGRKAAKKSTSSRSQAPGADTVAETSRPKPAATTRKRKQPNDDSGSNGVVVLNDEEEDFDPPREAATKIATRRVRKPVKQPTPIQTEDTPNHKPMRAATSRKRKQSSEDGDTDDVVVLDDEEGDPDPPAEESKEPASRRGRKAAKQPTPARSRARRSTADVDHSNQDDSGTAGEKASPRSHRSRAAARSDEIDLTGDRDNGHEEKPNEGPNGRSRRAARKKT